VRQSNERELIFIALAENLHRLEATPVDQARFFKRAQDKYGYTEDEMSDQSQLPQSTISERLSIIELGDDILARVSQDSKSPFKYTHAVALAQLKGAKRRAGEGEVRKLLEKTICYRLTTIELKLLVRLFTDKNDDKSSDKASYDTFDN
jgi:ParB-like chromosome segregation protein Spo0J